MFSRRIDPSPKSLPKPTVETIALRTTSKGAHKLWCGMGSGAVKVIDLASGKCEHVIQAHRQIVTCILARADGVDVWSGSFDRTICVMHTHGKKVQRRLTGHTDAVLCLTDAGDGTVYSAGLNGQLLRWDAATGALLSDPDYVLRSPSTQRPLPIYTLKVIDGTIWCGTGTSIAVLDGATLAIRARLPALGTSPAKPSLLVNAPAMAGGGGGVDRGSQPLTPGGMRMAPVGSSGGGSPLLRRRLGSAPSSAVRSATLSASTPVRGFRAAREGVGAAHPPP